MTAGRRRRRAATAPLRLVGWVVRNTAFMVAGVPVQLAALAVLALPWAVLWLVMTGPSGTHPFSPAGAAVVLVVSVLLVLAARMPLTALQRHRLWSLLGVDIRPMPTMPGQRLLPRLLSSLRSEACWRQLGYHLVAGPVIAMGGLLTLATWATGVAFAGAYLYPYLFPPLAQVRQDAGPKATLLLTVGGGALLLAAPAVAAAVRWLDVRAAGALLGPNRAVELERKVASLAVSRAGVVDAADAERRRIERDLHDGAQQRLVSLAMNLGLARENMTDLPEGARQVIVAAHEEAKEALTELRQLVRGLHPAVLDDRGLDAALSGITARAPLPVRLVVDVPERVSPTLEAVAYFVVSECLTNIARHARAGQADVSVQRSGGLLRIRVTDDGIGGARTAGGTGLASLAQRAGSVDGTLRIDSPDGGPTVITAELPCAS